MWPPQGDCGGFPGDQIALPLSVESDPGKADGVEPVDAIRREGSSVILDALSFHPHIKTGKGLVFATEVRVAMLLAVGEEVGVPLVP